MEHLAQLRNSLLVSVYIITQSCHLNTATSSYNTDKLHLETKNGIVFKDGNAFTGHLYTLSENGRDSLFSASYKEGRQDGPVTRWYPDGKLMETRFYQANAKTGTHSGFWSNGNKRFEYHFVNGNYQGVQKCWFEAGQRYQERTYKDGQEEGLQREWNESGSLMINYETHHGRQYGNIGKKNCASVWRQDVYTKPAN